ncbi:MAG: hypothetical protein FJ255_05715 [Phycisphaerae bacterium]|nr:hypothetical protein [Phycisphaerae bacterium]
MRTLLKATMLGVLAAWLVGCSSAARPTAQTVGVTLDPALARASTEVDLVAVSTADVGKWESQDVAAYFAQGKAASAGLERHEMRFGGGQPTAQELVKEDKKWSAWLKDGSRSHLVVLTNQGPGGRTPDPRRVVLDLRKEWPNQRIEMVVGPGGLTVLSSPVEKK